MVRSSSFAFWGRLVPVVPVTRMVESREVQPQRVTQVAEITEQVGHALLGIVTFFVTGQQGPLRNDPAIEHGIFVGQRLGGFTQIVTRNPNPRIGRRHDPRRWLEAAGFRSQYELVLAPLVRVLVEEDSLAVLRFRMLTIP